MNHELRGILPLFDDAEILTVKHMIKVPKGTKKLQRLPTSIKKLKVVGREGAIVSTFKKDGRLYMAVVNKDYQNEMKLYITADTHTTMVTKKLKETAINTYYKVKGGDLLLFKLK